MNANDPQPLLKKRAVNGTELAYFERNEARRDAPTLFFVHATGFHGRVWDYIIEQFPDCHVIALEQRGHGRSAKHTVDHWRTFGEDQAAFIDALGLTDLLGVGHSMGAHAMIDAAAKSTAFRRLLLCDPTVASPQDYEAAPEVDFSVLHPAARRRRNFASVEEMIEQLAPKSSFPLFHPRMLRDYCEHGLEDDGAGGLTLCCPPEVEAHVYMASRTNGGVYDSVREIDIPVTVVRAKRPPEDAPHDFASSPTWPGLAGTFSKGTEIHLEDCSHFIPMERPQLVVRLIQEFCAH